MTERERKILLALTPVQQSGFMQVKRDDLFSPFGRFSVNGGKLRQALWLMLSNDIKGVVSGSSIHSPQSAIIAAVAKYMKIPCVMMFGGTTENRLSEMPMPRLCQKFGAQIEILKMARHPVMFKNARDRAEELGYFVVEYGMNSKNPDFMEAFFKANANQVKNIPEDLDNLVITCGSGITATGVLQGIEMYGKKVRRMYLIGTAPPRLEKIRERCKMLGVEIKPEMIPVDLFNSPGFKYEKGESAYLSTEQETNIRMHPNYEAKSLNWLRANIDVKNEKTLFWIVGSEPTQ